MMNREDELTYQMECARNTLAAVVVVLRELSDELSTDEQKDGFHGVRRDDALCGCANALEAVRDDLRAAQLGEVA